MQNIQEQIDKLCDTIDMAACDAGQLRMYADPLTAILAGSIEEFLTEALSQAKQLQEARAAGCK